jgi:hypothetical protein
MNSVVSSLWSLVGFGQRRRLETAELALRAALAERDEWSAYPNLRLRPHAPNKGRGRLQVQIRRAFVGHHLLSSSQVYDYALARVRGDAWRRRHRWSVIRVLDRLCHRVGRADTIGRPWLWRLRDPAVQKPSEN